MKRSKIPATRGRALSVLKTAMIEKKLTQFQLADAADCHEKTIQNLLAGRPVRDQTLFDVCMVLDLDFDDVKCAWAGRQSTTASKAPEAGRAAAAAATTGAFDSHMPHSEKPARAPGIAPLYMGGYTRSAVDHYIGSYLTLRPAFDGGCEIIAYRTEVFWSDLANALCFREQDRPDAAYSHRGHLYIPSSSMFIHLVSLTKGAMRMVLLSQIDQFGKMRGIITTLNKAIGAAFTPVAAPIVYDRRQDFGGVSFGTIAPCGQDFEHYKALLDETLDDSYVRLLGSC